MQIGVRVWQQLSVALFFLVASIVLVAPLGAQAPPDDFSIVVLPDPQNYSQFHPEIFKQQTRWIVDHRAEFNTQFVIGVGDMVNHPDSTTEWQNADEAIEVLDAAAMPYAMAIGNHDYDGLHPSSRGATAFNHWFGVARYAANPAFKSALNDSTENFYETPTVGNTEYLVLTLEFYPRDATIEWADVVLAQYPNDPVIVVTHSFMYIDNTRVDVCDTNDMNPANGNNGNALWQKFIARHENIFLVVSGHISRKAQSQRTDPGMNGRLVMQTLQDWQDYPNGGDGWLRVYTFHPANNSVDVRTYSPYRDSIGKTAWLTDAENQFSFPISAHVSPASATGKVKGKVRVARTGSSNDCSPVPGVEVEVAGFDAITDTNGIYEVDVPAPNTYAVALDAPGWSANTEQSAPWPGFTDQVEVFASGSSPSPPPPPPPPPPTSCGASVTGVNICTPGSGASVSSPFEVQAAAKSSVSVTLMQVYLDGALLKSMTGSAIDVSISAAAGTHRLTVQAKDAN